jgi:hypothetical protein
MGIGKMENEERFDFVGWPSCPLSCCFGLNQPRGRDNGWVLAMLAALRVALVQRMRVPLSLSSGRFPRAANERTLTA